jgi:hypothetical protein
VKIEGVVMTSFELMISVGAGMNERPSAIVSIVWERQQTVLCGFSEK